MIITIIATIGFVLILSAAAIGVALFVKDADRRQDAYRLLKLLLGTGGGSGLIASVLQLLAG
ncbi:hypothetical protein [Kribbella flavida]|nr:hypothetical protein [Kribbella flavida]